MSFLQRHPFPVLAHFERVLALTYAFPVSTLQPLVPSPLEIDQYEEFGFITVAVVWTRQLRPAGFPAWMGNDFFLAGYRIFTRLRDNSGRRLRGLKIMRSETDKHQMVWMGNLLTKYSYRHVDVLVKQSEAKLRIETSTKGKPTLEIECDISNSPAKLPEGSPFPDWHTARQFAGPMPYTFSPEANGDIVVVEGRRASWKPRPISVTKWSVGLFDEAPLRGVKPVLANAFAVEEIPYRWEKGRIVRTAIGQ